jgi:hypothetical protein
MNPRPYTALTSDMRDESGDTYNTYLPYLRGVAHKGDIGKMMVGCVKMRHLLDTKVNDSWCVVFVCLKY